MTIITWYQCDICKEKYTLEQEALSCEAIGVFSAGKDYPAGRMWEHHHGGYVGILTFAHDVSPCNTYYRRNHYGADKGLWACRAPGYPGDTLGRELCGGNDYYENGEEALKHWIEHHYIDEHLNGPEFKRMVKFLKSQGITPSYYTKAGQLIVLKNR